MGKIRQFLTVDVEEDVFGVLAVLVVHDADRGTEVAGHLAFNADKCGTKEHLKKLLTSTRN